MIQWTMTISWKRMIPNMIQMIKKDQIVKYVLALLRRKKMEQ